VSQLFVLDINTVQWRFFLLNLPPFFWEISHVSPAFQKRSQLTSGLPSLQSKRKRYEYEPKHFSLSSPKTKWSELFYTLFYTILFYSILFYSILFYSILFYSIHSFYTVDFVTVYVNNSFICINLFSSKRQWRWKSNILSHVSHTKPVLFYYLLCIILYYIILYYIELTLF